MLFGPLGPWPTLLGPTLLFDAVLVTQRRYQVICLYAQPSELMGCLALYVGRVIYSRSIETGLGLT
jgi:hypothetical protein